MVQIDKDSVTLQSLINARRLFSWWYGEIVGGFSYVVSKLPLEHEKTTKVLYTGGERTVENHNLNVRAAIGSDEKSWRELIDLLRPSGNRSQIIRVVLNDGLFLSRTNSYPDIAIQHLEKIVDTDVLGATPFDQSNALWNWRLINRANGNVEVETVILRKSLVDQIAALAHQFGIEIAAIEVVTDDREKTFQIVEFDTSATRRNRMVSRLNLAAAGLFVILGMATLAVSYRGHQTAHYVLAAKVVEERTQLTDLRRRQKDVVSVFEANAVLLKTKIETPSFIHIWNTLSKELPSSVWLSELRISGNRGRMSGFAESAAPLIERLETLDVFENVSFASPVRIDRQNNLERFDISFSLEILDE